MQAWDQCHFLSMYFITLYLISCSLLCLVSPQRKSEMLIWCHRMILFLWHSCCWRAARVRFQRKIFFNPSDERMFISWFKSTHTLTHTQSRGRWLAEGKSDLRQVQTWMFVWAVTKQKVLFTPTLMLHGNVLKNSPGFLDRLMCCTVFEILARFQKSGLETFQGISKMLRDCMTIQKMNALQEIYFSECTVGSTRRMLLDPHSRQIIQGRGQKPSCHFMYGAGLIPQTP